MLLHDWLKHRRTAHEGEFRDLVALDTVSPDDGAAHGWLSRYFEELGGTVVAQPRHEDLARHPAANHNVHLDAAAEDRCNLRVTFPLRPGLRHTLFSAHVDVVPAGPFPDAFALAVTPDRVTGRGVTDTKGNILMLGAALRFLRDTGHSPVRDVSVDLVIEEEIGGNGALSAVLHRPAADEVVVLEPTGLEVLRGHRGCLEFTIEVATDASHMGGGGQSAIDQAVELMGLLKALEAELIDDALDDPAFASWARPLQINIGLVRGGEWPGSRAQRCELTGYFGFHPKHDAAAARRLLETRVDAAVRDWTGTTVAMSYRGIHNEGYVWPAGSRPERDLLASGAATAPAETTRAWNVSCDARLYAQLLDIPTVIFGAGSLDEAHSSHESLSWAEWEDGVAVLVAFLTGETRSVERQAR